MKDVKQFSRNTITITPRQDFKVIPSITLMDSPKKNFICPAYLPVFGDSMRPMINSGEIVALKKVDNPEYIQYGEPHLIITNAMTNNMRTLKIVRKHKDESMIILQSINPDYDDLAIPRNSILILYIVKRKITRNQF